MLTLLYNVSRPLLLTTSLVGLLFGACIVNAHESHENRIHHIEQQLDQVSSDSSNESVALILNRADLHRRQMEWDAALLDYQHVAEKEPNNLAMLLGRVQLHLDQQQYSQAVSWSTHVQRLYPAHALGGLQYARALAGVGEVDVAASEFERAIGLLNKPNPEHYIEHAQLMLARGNNSYSIQRAIAILDKGLNALSHPISLQASAYELEFKYGYYKAALSRIENILTRNSTLLNWRLKRGELLLEMGRQTAAHDELLCLIYRIRQLPAQRRGSRAFQVMKQRSQDLLQGLDVTDNEKTISRKMGAKPDC